MPGRCWASSNPTSAPAWPRLAVRHGWSVRETERQVVQHLAVSTPPATHDPIKPAATTNRHLADLEARLSRHLGTRVRIQPSRRKGRGKLIIDFYSLDEFDGLMQRLGLTVENETDGLVLFLSVGAMRAASRGEKR